MSEQNVYEVEYERKSSVGNDWYHNPGYMKLKVVAESLEIALILAAEELFSDPTATGFRIFAAKRILTGVIQ